MHSAPARPYEFELSQDALEIMPYGIAGDLLKSDVSTQYGQIYSARYNEMLQRLDHRYQLATEEEITFAGIDSESLKAATGGAPYSEESIAKMVNKGELNAVMDETGIVHITKGSGSGYKSNAGAAVAANAPSAAALEEYQKKRQSALQAPASATYAQDPAAAAGQQIGTYIVNWIKGLFQ